jgi:hypothetical protein
MTADAEHGAAKRFTPKDCPHCEYDRRFPGFAGGWMQQDNNGPIVSCPLCNPDGNLVARP